MMLVTSPALQQKLRPVAELLEMKIESASSADAIIALKPAVVIAEASIPAEVNIMYKLRQTNAAIPRILAFSTHVIPLNVMISMRVAHRFLDLNAPTAELASAIGDAMRLTEIFASPEVQKCVMELAFLPQLPDLFVRVEEVVHMPGASLAKAGEVIEKDQTVAGQVLKLVNAAAFAGNKPITKISEAVTRIGINNLKAVILAVSVFSGKIVHGTQVDFNTLNPHAFVTARCCRLIAEKEHLPVWSQDILFLAGLLHDIGSLVLITSQPKLYEKLLLKAQAESTSMLALEKEAFGVDHALLGGYICRAWGFPDVISELIMQHHYSEKEDISFNILRAADILSQRLLYNGVGEGVPAEMVVRDDWARACKSVIQEALTEIATAKA